MELKGLKHTLNGVLIDEPIGFDQLKTTMKRGDYHGMSVEVSVGTLEFYGEAANIITHAYNTDIDTELTYKVETDRGDVLYSGVLDLATYNEKNGAYRSVEVNVGEVGIKTTFNNRVEVPVDLNSQITMDGNEIAHAPNWLDLPIPYKTIRYVNMQNQVKTTIYKYSPNTGNQLALPDDFVNAWLNICLDNNAKQEFGTMNPTFHIAAIEDSTVAGYAEPFCTTNNGSDIDEDSDIIIKVSLDMSIMLPEGPAQDNYPFENLTDTPQLEVVPVVKINGYMRQEPSMSPITITNDNYTIPQQLTLVGTYTIKKRETASIFVGLEIVNKNVNGKGDKGYNNPSKLYLTIKEGSYIEVTLNSKAEDKVSAPLIMVHEALNTIAESISNNALSVKSNLYGRTDSVVHKQNMIGDGALKAITNGYKIRNLYTDENNERNMPLSFKEMIESLNAIDCIGWGFSQEDNTTCLRVEKWDWFYQNNKLLEINEPAELTRKIDTDKVISELNIGYKKYATADDISSIDSLHGERTFTTSTKSFSNQKSALCEFIADNYAIEETRRAAMTTKKDEEFKYDENVFVFGLLSNENGYVIVRDTPQQGNDTIANIHEAYNTLISPTRNAVRWISRLFCLNGLKPFKLTKGTINYKAIVETEESRNGVFVIPDLMNSIPDQSEDMPLQEQYGEIVIPRVFKAEEVALTYPINLEQYQAIKQNPYGLVVVDGEECWIKEFTYDFNTSEAEFKLTPKAK